jgi:hypothetical protein
MNKGLLFQFEVYADEKNSSINMATWKVNFYYKI